MTSNSGLDRTVRHRGRTARAVALRARAGAGIARVFYCTVIDRRMVFLHSFVKKTERPVAGRTGNDAPRYGNVIPAGRSTELLGVK